MSIFALTKTDLKYTLRLLGKNPGSTVLSVMVLAFGLGVSVFTFTLTYIMFYKPIPISNGESIVRICSGVSDSGCRSFSAFDFFQLRDEIELLENVGIYTSREVYIETQNINRYLRAGLTEWTQFQLTDTQAWLGRTLREFDHDANGEGVAILSYTTWKNVFSGNEEIIDTSISVSGKVVKIIGVMPEGYKFPGTIQIWLPITTTLLTPITESDVSVIAFGSIRDDVSRSDANKEMDKLMKRVRQLYPLDLDAGDRTNSDQYSSAHIRSLPRAAFGGTIGTILFIVLNSIAALVFLLACINAGTLLLARTNERLKDISIRVALGAPIKRLLMQTMNEGVVISILGGVLAVFVAGIGLEAFNIFMVSQSGDAGSNFWLVFHLDSSALIAVLFFVLSTILFTSVIPCWRIVRGDFNAVMRDGTRGTVGIKSGSFSRLLVVVAIVLITLLLNVGTLLGSLAFTYKEIFTNPNASQLMGTELRLEPSRYTATQKLLFYQSLKELLSRSASIDDVLIFNTAGRFGIEREGVNYATEYDNSQAIVQQVSGSIATAGALLLEGRNLNDFDTANVSPTVVISRSLAENLWPQQSAIGHRIRVVNFNPTDGDSWRTIVGVVNDTQIPGQSLLTLEMAVVYLPLAQGEALTVRTLVKFNSDIDNAITLFSRTILSLDPELKVNVRDWERNQDMVVKGMNSGISLILGLGLFSFLIAIAGIFGLTSNSIRLRTQEIGTKRALGATDNRISRTYVAQGGKQVLVGIIVGVVAASPLSYLIFTSADSAIINVALPFGFVVIVGLFAALLLAIYQPVRNILRLEPSEALRHE